MRVRDKYEIECRASAVRMGNRAVETTPKPSLSWIEHQSLGRRFSPAANTWELDGCLPGQDGEMVACCLVLCMHEDER
jgi:hypothetical protein